MEREITGRRPHFSPIKRSSNPYRILLWFCLIAGGVWLLTQIQSGQVEPLFLPTPTPTRTPDSYQLEGKSAFDAGHLDAAIAAYRQAVNFDPANVEVWTELARIQTYSSSLRTTAQDRYTRLQDALDAIDQAVALDPDNPNVLAIRAFVLDWFAHNRLVPAEERRSMLNEAEREASRAYTLDPNNALALAFYAEILVDQQKWSQAEQYIIQAESIDKNSMDIYRIYGYIMESQGYYRAAIDYYLKAANINPNLTFLYIRIGMNFRELDVHDRALEYFERAVRINDQLGISDPVPYIEIAKTYTRDGEFFIAALNAEKALSIDPLNANTYGQLGSIYVQARNYESAMPAFRCAVLGCTAEENEIAKQLLGAGVEVSGLPLSSLTVAYYYAQYGSVLAAMSRPGENHCGLAFEVLDQVQQAFPDDSTLLSIIEENRNICNRVGATR